MFHLLDDTIAAISSPPGYGPRGIVRVSGPRAIAIATELFVDDLSLPLDDVSGEGGMGGRCPAVWIGLRADANPREPPFEHGSGKGLAAGSPLADPCHPTLHAPPLGERQGFRRFRGEVRIGGASVPAELYLFRAPRSYTRQDLVEFHTIGSPVVLSMLLEEILARGACGAEPGEFTARAFFNGAMSLDQAEGVAALINARSDAQLRAAQRLHEQTAIQQATDWMQRLGDLLALVEADIDFAEEPLEFMTPEELGDRLAALRAELDALLCGAEDATRFDVLPTILLLGPPNAGKSSLMNQLSGTDRAICSAVAGTTRDILSAPVTLPGMEALLLDSAGLEEKGVRNLFGGDNSEGVIAAEKIPDPFFRRTAAQVDLLCLVLDVSTGPSKTVLQVLREHPRQPAVIAANKVDLVSVPECAARLTWLRAAELGPVVATSAVTGVGLAELKATIQAQLGESPAGDEERGVLLTARHRQALAGASAALDRALVETQDIGRTLDRAETIAFELREALNALGAIHGHVTPEDLLNQVFANFCIGK